MKTRALQTPNRGYSIGYSILEQLYHSDFSEAHKGSSAAGKPLKVHSECCR